MGNALSEILPGLKMIPADEDISGNLNLYFTIERSHSSSARWICSNPNYLTEKPKHDHEIIVTAWFCVIFLCTLLQKLARRGFIITICLIRGISRAWIYRASSANELAQCIKTCYLSPTPTSIWNRGTSNPVSLPGKKSRRNLVAETEAVGNFVRQNSGFVAWKQDATQK